MTPEQEAKWREQFEEQRCPPLIKMRQMDGLYANHDARIAWANYLAGREAQQREDAARADCLAETIAAQETTITTLRAQIAAMQAGEVVFAFDDLGISRDVHGMAKRCSELRDRLVNRAPPPAAPAENLSCKSVQKRLAAQWGYVKADEQPAAPVVPDEGKLWSFLRNTMMQGSDIRQDHLLLNYEIYSARLDAAASERVDALIAMLAAAPQFGETK